MHIHITCLHFSHYEIVGCKLEKKKENKIYFLTSSFIFSNLFFFFFVPFFLLFFLLCHFSRESYFLDCMENLRNEVLFLHSEVTSLFLISNKIKILHTLLNSITLLRGVYIYSTNRSIVCCIMIHFK